VARAERGRALVLASARRAAERGRTVVLASAWRAPNARPRSRERAARAESGRTVVLASTRRALKVDEPSCSRARGARRTHQEVRLGILFRRGSAGEC